jgi:hypothetical protein
MAVGENFIRICGNSMQEIKRLTQEVQKAKENFWAYMNKIEWYYDDKAIRLEKQIEVAEYNLWCEEYEDNRRRNWK